MDNGSKFFVSAIGIAIFLLFLSCYLDSDSDSDSDQTGLMGHDPNFIQEVELIYEDGTTRIVHQNVVNTEIRQVIFRVIVANTSIKEVRIWTLQ
jgi:hypothetical protein